jgi:hypothetical protein
VNAERELGILNAVSEALNSSPDVRQALERTLSLVAELLGLRTGWVWLLDQDTNRFYDAAERELPPYLQERVRMAGRRRCWCIDDFRDGDLTPTNIDVMECSRLQPAFRGKSAALAAGLRYHASIPLYFQDKPLGIMNVTGPEWRKLTAEELRLLSTIASQVGIAIERARLAEDATRLARAEERTRIAREIHDTLAQGLTAIALNIEGAMRQLEMYQTAYAGPPGSAEMPSAGRAFSPNVLERLAHHGIGFVTLTLHTGVASLEGHEKPYAEELWVPELTARAVRSAKAEGRRVIAVGTTVVRALESAADDGDGEVIASHAWTELAITPERGVRVVDSLLTGFHEPKASHLAMLEAIAGRRHLEVAYQAALDGRYLWHEFGDLHLILGD